MIGGLSRGAHGREEHAGEVVVASAKAHHDVGFLGAVGRGIHAVVDAVHQQIEVDALRRQRSYPTRPWRWGAWLASVFDGLWHSTQYSVLLRRPPCSESATWQLLQLLSATTVRRGCYRRAIHREVHHRVRWRPYETVCDEVVPASTVTLVRASPPMVYVPVAAAGMACVKVYVQAPLELQVAFEALSVT